eukprot:2802793-Rhodomonas_salina.3
MRLDAVSVIEGSGAEVYDPVPVRQAGGIDPDHVRHGSIIVRQRPEVDILVCAGEDNAVLAHAAAAVRHACPLRSVDQRGIRDLPARTPAHTRQRARGCVRIAGEEAQSAALLAQDPKLHLHHLHCAERAPIHAEVGHLPIPELGRYTVVVVSDQATAPSAAPLRKHTRCADSQLPVDVQRSQCPARNGYSHVLPRVQWERRIVYSTSNKSTIPPNVECQDPP